MNTKRHMCSILVQKQCAQLVEEAGYTCMLCQIALLNELSDGASARVHAWADRLEATCKTARCTQIDICCRLEREEWL